MNEFQVIALGIGLFISSILLLKSAFWNLERRLTNGDIQYKVEKGDI